jgi:hypothetical protein
VGVGRWSVVTTSLKVNGREVEAPLTRAVLLGVLYVVGPPVLLAVFLLVLPFMVLAALVDAIDRALAGGPS